VVRFEKADHLWGKETIETTVAVREEKGDRGIEVLCIGPAGERGVPFANVVNRFSWTS
jgi:aldehyde:ferredoxin oxidoreductase